MCERGSVSVLHRGADFVCFCVLYMHIRGKKKEADLLEGLIIH